VNGDRIDPEQHMVVVKLASQWVEQAKEAWADLEASQPDPPPRRFAAWHAANPAAFGRFVEAYYALFPHKVTQEIIDLAGLKPVDQVISDG
jgi:hypothetical protein